MLFFTDPQAYSNLKLEIDCRMRITVYTRRPILIRNQSIIVRFERIVNLCRVTVSRERPI